MCYNNVVIDFTKGDNRMNNEGRGDENKAEEVKTEEIKNEITSDTENEEVSNEEASNDAVEDETVEKKKKMKWWAKTLIIIGSVIAFLLIAMFVVYQVYMSRVNYETEEDWKITSSPSNVSSEGVSVMQQADRFEDGDTIKNFLLIGVENIGYSDELDEGNTDCMIILSINTDTKTVKMVSFMRDMYAVMLELNKATKLNNVYNNGGGKLLTETIENMFGVTIDGRAVVKFDDFEQIIDLLGGVNITLTDTEAGYLNTTNYISNRAYRNVVAGKNHLNGNQALGYSRVRKVNSYSGKDGNEGRNERQRNVLMSLYKKYKEKSLLELTGLVYDVLPLIYKTNIKVEDAVDVVTVVKDMNIKNIESINMPIEGTYHSQHAVEGINPNVMNDFTIVDDMEANQKALEDFLCGTSDETADSSASPSPSPSAKAAQ